MDVPADRYYVQAVWAVRTRDATDSELRPRGKGPLDRGQERTERVDLVPR